MMGTGKTLLDVTKEVPVSSIRAWKNVRKCGGTTRAQYNAPQG